MLSHDDLIRENAELHARLALAERWMRREVQSAIALVQREWVKKTTRKHFENIFEEKGVEIITNRILGSFGEILDHAPKYTLERLIDAEIYWETLQRYPHMDALPIVLAYQKILDAWIEEVLIDGFRISHREGYGESEMKRDSLSLPVLLLSSQWREHVGIKKDIENILTKNYTLSIGRLYQILSYLRDGWDISPWIAVLVDYWKGEFPEILEVLISDNFFLPFSFLMKEEIFSKKRHDKKVSFRDAKKTREIIIGSSESPSLLWVIFSS
jgi:hypothetical protein